MFGFKVLEMGIGRYKRSRLATPTLVFNRCIQNNRNWVQSKLHRVSWVIEQSNSVKRGLNSCLEYERCSNKWYKNDDVQCQEERNRSVGTCARSHSPFTPEQPTFSLSIHTRACELLAVHSDTHFILPRMRPFQRERLQ